MTIDSAACTESKPYVSGSVAVAIALIAAMSVAIGAAAGCGAPSPRSPAKQITAFAFLAANNPGLGLDVTATISGTAITATVPFGPHSSERVATFETTGARVSVGGTLQVSGATVNDFRQPVVYRVADDDGSTQDYAVAITVARSPAKALTALSFRAALNPVLPDDVTATIDGTTITATVPFGSDVTRLIATFATTGASVAVGGVPQVSGTTPNDFRSTVTYRVTADDGSTRDYFVLVTVAPAPKDLTALSFRKADNPGLPGNVVATIHGTRVVATVASGTPVTALVATFTTTGASVTVGGVRQTSGVTPNDFTHPLVYRVVGADGLTRDYTVAVVQETYVKASNTGGDDEFGTSVAVSADGSTLAVGAWSERSAATGINGDQRDDSVIGAGAVYVFVRSGATWTQQAYIKASNTGEVNSFGASVALSADGSILAVGAEFEDSAATGIDGNQADNSAAAAGAVYVFVRSGATWTQQAYIKASNTDAGDQFGSAVALSANGSTLAVGAVRESGAATGVNGNQASNSAFSAGAVYVFVRSGATWTQQAYVKASNTESGDQFGGSVALSSDGSTLAVGANAESSAATGINGNQGDNSASLSGAVYVFTRSGTTWSQQAYLKASNTGGVDFFGEWVALSGDGSTLAVGAPEEDSAATGIGGSESSNAARDSGAVYVFARSGATWTQQAYVKASNTGAGDHFGQNVALSGDGSMLIVGAPDEASAATGTGGDQASNAVMRAGVVYVFTHNGSTWSQRDYVKASNTGANDEFGDSVAVTADGATLVVGAHFESSQATGINGDQSDDFDAAAGAVYVFDP
jgi:hypothetical protein